MPATVLAENNPAFRHAHAGWVHDFVSRSLFKVTVLMNASFVCESVFADDRLIWLRTERNKPRQHLAGGEQLLCVDLRLKRQAIVTCLNRHHYLFQGRIARTLADAIDRALHLPRTSLHRR